MYTLHIANKNYSSWSLRPWVLMRALDIPFRERLHHLGAASGETFTDFSPSGKVPCLVDGVTVVWDSLAIAEYLAELHSGVWPQDAKSRAWARSAAAERWSPKCAEVYPQNRSNGVRWAMPFHKSSS